MPELTAEEKRLQEDHQKKAIWHHWGPYLAARQWGNVREDYSADGEAWKYFTFDDARMRAFRWGEDSIAGSVTIIRSYALPLYFGTALILF